MSHQENQGVGWGGRTGCDRRPLTLFSSQIQGFDKPVDECNNGPISVNHNPCVDFPAHSSADSADSAVSQRSCLFLVHQNLGREGRLKRSNLGYCLRNKALNIYIYTHFLIMTSLSNNGTDLSLAYMQGCAKAW